MPQALGYPAAQQQQAVTQPAAPVEQSALPDPISVLDGQLNLLRTSFEQRARRIEEFGFKDAKEHNYYVTKLQQESDARKLEIMQVRDTLSMIQSGIASGHIDPDAGAKAMYGLVLPKDVVAAMYPKPQDASQEGPTRRPFTPNTLTDYRELAKEFADAGAKDGRRGFDPVTRQNLQIRQYLAFRQNTGYDDSSQITNAERRQLDSEWDAVMRTEGHQWDPTAPEIKSLRTYGDPVLQAAANKVSPMARSLAAQQKQAQKKERPKPQESIIGSTLTRGGRRWRVVGVDTDGTPLVEPAN
jgi:hypothetical protein